MDTNGVVLAAYHVLPLLPPEPEQAQVIISLIEGRTNGTRHAAWEIATVNAVKHELPKKAQDRCEVLRLLTTLLTAAAGYVRDRPALASNSIAARSSRTLRGRQSAKP
jgi:hypothetical protein